MFTSDRCKQLPGSLLQERLLILNFVCRCMEVLVRLRLLATPFATLLSELRYVSYTLLVELFTCTATGSFSHKRSDLHNCAGTSPLYVFPNIFRSEPSRDNVLGAMSLIFWILTIVIILKYVTIVLHANDNGEGKRSHSSPYIDLQCM